MLRQGAAKERFNEIQQELSQLSTKFSNNLLDATKAFKKLLKDPAEVRTYILEEWSCKSCPGDLMPVSCSCGSIRSADLCAIATTATLAHVKLLW